MSLSVIAPLLAALEQAGASRIYVIDNTPAGEEGAVEGETRAGHIELIRAGANLGYGRGHNLAIRRSVEIHRYHLVLNPDITLPPDCLDTLIDYMESHTEVGLCMPKLIGTDGTIQYCCRRSPVLLDYLSQVLAPRSWGRRRRASLELRSQDYDRVMEVPCLSGCFMLFRSEVLASLGGFDERFFMYFEDFDLSLRASMRGRNVYLPAAHVVHERQSAHRRSWRMRFVFARSACQYFSKWGWFSPRRPAAPPT